MYIPGRYDAYTGRYDVYLFTLRDWVEMLNLRYGGHFIDRSDMPVHTGYLVKFDKATEVIAFLNANATEADTKTKGDKFSLLTLPALSGNDLPVYATVNEDCDVVYIGLSTYADALDSFFEGSQQ